MSKPKKPATKSDEPKLRAAVLHDFLHGFAWAAIAKRHSVSVGKVGNVIRLLTIDLGLSKKEMNELRDASVLLYRHKMVPRSRLRTFDAIFAVHVMHLRQQGLPQWQVAERLGTVQAQVARYCKIIEGCVELLENETPQRGVPLLAV